jgi:hypothetical protein
MTKLWRKWVILTKKFASFLATLVLTIIYFLVVAPLGIFIKLFAPKVLLGHDTHQKTNSYWIKKKQIKQDLSFAKQQ